MRFALLVKVKVIISFIFTVLFSLVDLISFSSTLLYFFGVSLYEGFLLDKCLPYKILKLFIQFACTYDSIMIVFEEIEKKIILIFLTF